MSEDAIMAVKALLDARMQELEAERWLNAAEFSEKLESYVEVCLMGANPVWFPVDWHGACPGCHDYHSAHDYEGIPDA